MTRSFWRCSTILAICASCLSATAVNLQHGSALQRRQNQDVVPSPETYLRRRLHAAVRAGKYLYIDGGQISYNQSGQSTGVVNTQNTTLSLDLSKDWDNSTIRFNSIEKPSDMTVLSKGVLWYHEAEDLIYSGFVGDSQDRNPPPALWALKPNDNGGGTWSSKLRPGAQQLEGLKRSTRALTAQGPDSGWVLNGVAPDFSYIEGMTQLDLGVNEFHNITSSEAFPEPAQQGALQFVPGFGEKGLLVAFGSLSAGPDYPENTKVPVFDVAGQKWYDQSVTGDMPKWRNWYCTAGSPSTNGTYEIFMYGGFIEDGNRAVQYDDVHILTIPAFNWIKVPYEAKNPRGGHTCTPVGNGQILVAGGDDPTVPRDPTGKMMTKDIWRQGLGVFDLSTLKWTDGYKSSNSDTYQQANPIKEYYVANGGTPKNPSDPHIANLLAGSVDAPTSSTSQTPATTSTPPESSKNISNHAGVIAGSVIGGLAATTFLAITIVIFRRHAKASASKHPKDSNPSSQEISISENGYRGPPGGQRHYAEMHGQQRLPEMGGEQRAQELGGDGVQEMPGSLKPP